MKFNTRPEVEHNPELFQQDEATVHIARPTMTFLREIFSERIISCLPDLPASYFFLWGYLKAKPTSIQQLKVNIREEVRALRNCGKCCGKSTSGQSKQWSPF